MGATIQAADGRLMNMHNAARVSYATSVITSMQKLWIPSIEMGYADHHAWKEHFLIYDHSHEALQLPQIEAFPPAGYLHNVTREANSDELNNWMTNSAAASAHFAVTSAASASQIWLPSLWTFSPLILTTSSEEQRLRLITTPLQPPQLPKFLTQHAILALGVVCC